jgi:hypothetical protein
MQVISSVALGQLSILIFALILAFFLLRVVKRFLGNRSYKYLMEIVGLSLGLGGIIISLYSSSIAVLIINLGLLVYIVSYFMKNKEK